MTRSPKPPESDAANPKVVATVLAEPSLAEASEREPRAEQVPKGPGAERTATPTEGEGFDVTKALVGLLIALSAVMVMWNLQTTSMKNANTASRYAAIQSLVDYGTYSINESQYRFTIDKMKVGKHYISSKPPTLPTYAAGTYWIFQKLTGKTLANNEGAAVWWVSLCTGWLAHVIFLIYLYRLCKILLRRQLAVISTVAVGGFATLGVAYATAINNHSISAAMGLVGLYYACRIRHQRDAKLRHWVQSGLCFGFMTSVDLPSGAFMVAAFFYLATYDWRRTLLLFVPAMLPGIVIHQSLTYGITGSWKPTYLNSDLKDFADNYFRQKRTGIDGLNEPKHIYGFNVLFGHHGLFSMTPLFFLSAWEIIRSIRFRRFLPETLLVASLVLVITSFYIFKSRNYGGWSVGMRHMVPIMPLLVLYFGLWLDRVRLTQWVWAGVLAAFSVSAFHVQDGLTSPFQFSVWHNWLDGTPNRARVGKTWTLTKKRKSDTSHQAGGAAKNSSKAPKKGTKKGTKKASKPSPPKRAGE
jgi:hypothetical protein